MRDLVAVSVVVLALGLCLSACGSSSEGPVRLGEEDAGSTVRLQVGDTMEVILDGNPTTGFMWERPSEDEDTAILQQMGEPAFEPDTDLVGSGGKVTLVFEAVAPGQKELRLVYHRPFENDVSPKKTFSVTVIVQ